MNKQKWILAVVALVLIGTTAGLLDHFRTHQKLGKPGVKTKPLPNSNNLEVLLPEHVLDYKSEALEVDKIVLDTLPKDTSYGSRRYEEPDHSWAILNVVLMGTDRTSLHQPQFCLIGQGWALEPPKREVVRMERPRRYDLPVIKITATKDLIQDGQRVTARGIYVYWFVSDGELTATSSGMDLMWKMGRDLIRKGILGRWAYISCFSVCFPGQEEATFDKMKRFIAASVPEFQLTPSVDTAALTAQ